ncbi:putative brefeldin A-sensitive peripheral Golgi protein, partial [Operophtera brumata]
MEHDLIEFTLPPAPRGLCFDRNDFVKSNFSVDNFLADHQNVVSLESMRDDLGTYLKVLRLAMIELINKDYANFVNLCATLIGFDKTISKIQVPLGQLNEEVVSVKQCLEDAMKELSMWMSQRHTLQKKKQHLKYYSQTFNSLSTLENILSNISDKKTDERVALADRATMQYNQLKFSITKCENLIKPEQKTQFKERSKEGLEEVYDRILSLLDTKLKLLLVVTKHSKLTFLVKKYRFFINCFWCEVESRLEVNLSSIFAPGNPQIFYRRYNESLRFVRKMEEYCPDNESLKFLRATIEYKSFQKRWNLPNTPTKEPCDGYLLKETQLCWKALQECWSDGIYIEALGHKFWKLSLQVLARYATWASSYCTQRTGPQRYEPTHVNKVLLENSISIYVDVQALIQQLPQFLELVLSRFSTNVDLLKKSLESSEETLQGTRNKVKECIVNELFDNFNVQLKQVSDIPRLYRKTNRSVPTKPCTYLDVVSNALREFSEDAFKKLDNAFVVELLESLFNVMTVSYYKYVEDVLTSVHKTEESLRRLKQIREMSQQSSDSVGTTDGDKIRLQLNVDVIFYGKLIESVKINIHSVQKYTELSTMVTEAVKNIDIK